jgi:hypothetical protein
MTHKEMWRTYSNPDPQGVTPNLKRISRRIERGSITNG